MMVGMGIVQQVVTLRKCKVLPPNYCCAAEGFGATAGTAGHRAWPGAVADRCVHLASMVETDCSASSATMTNTIV